MTCTKAERERLKLESDRRAAAAKAKGERMAREALLEQRQQERCQTAHRAASTLRANTTAAVMAQRAELHRELNAERNELHKLRQERRVTTLPTRVAADSAQHASQYSSHKSHACASAGRLHRDMACSTTCRCFLSPENPS